MSRYSSPITDTGNEFVDDPAGDREPTVLFVGEPDEAVYDEPYDYWNDVEQGMYDDDPSPYDGNYSEM